MLLLFNAAAAAADDDDDDDVDGDDNTDMSNILSISCGAELPRRPENKNRYS